jgi:hypothetical protein
MTRFPFGRHLGSLIAGVTCLGCLALASSASADGGQLPASEDARTFSGGVAGWTSSTAFEPSCAPPLLCPTVTNSYVAAGDADGNGYVTSADSGVAGVGAVAGSSRGVWESPTFTYRATSDGPESASFSMSRRADVGQLLAVAGNSAEYSVTLRDLTEGARSLTVIAPTTLAGAEAWTTTPKATLEAGRLNSGDRYRIRIESIYTTGTSVIAGGSADYDNVVLRTAASEGAKEGGNGAGGANGGGRRHLRSGELLRLFSSGLAGKATVAGRGRTLRVRVRCPRKIGSACRVTARGLLRKHRPATLKRTVKIGSGRHRNVVVRVKPKLRARVAKRKRLLVSERVRAGGASATAYRIRKLIRRPRTRATRRARP